MTEKTAGCVMTGSIKTVPFNEARIKLGNELTDADIRIVNEAKQAAHYGLQHLQAMKWGEDTSDEVFNAYLDAVDDLAKAIMDRAAVIRNLRARIRAKPATVHPIGHR